jgi:hypothetical protein
VDLGLKRDDLRDQQVFTGGPVQTDRGFVLHEPMVIEGAPENESAYASTMTIPGGLEMTTSKDVLEALSDGAGPKRVLVTLGYSSWDEGQLESEIGENAWLTVEADPEVIFSTRWTSAMTALWACWVCSAGCCPQSRVAHERYFLFQQGRRCGLFLDFFLGRKCGCQACISARAAKAEVPAHFQQFLGFDFGIKRTGCASATACWAAPTRCPPSRPKGRMHAWPQWKS